LVAIGVSDTVVGYLFGDSVPRPMRELSVDLARLWLAGADAVALRRNRT